jgi:hypothetical protein
LRVQLRARERHALLRSVLLTGGTSRIRAALEEIDAIELLVSPQITEPVEVEVEITRALVAQVREEIGRVRDSGASRSNQPASLEPRDRRGGRARRLRPDVAGLER